MKPGGLWHNRNFMMLWSGETISLFGSQVTMLALPLTAATLLNATPEQMGLLNAAGFAPFLLITLFAGVWLDRHRKRPVLVAANLGRVALLLLVPLLAWENLLRIEHLYVLVFLIGVLAILFELSYQSYIPVLLQRDDLPTANSRLFASAAAAEVGGPGIAGALIEVATAPFALVVDAASFLVAGLGVLLIRQPEPMPRPTAHSASVLSEIRSGMRLMLRNPYLRLFVGEAATYNFFNQAFVALFVVYATRELGFTPGVLGLIFAAGSLGSLVGSIVTVPVSRRIGIGRCIMIGGAISSIVPLLIPLATGPYALPVLLIVYSVIYFGISLTNVHTFSIRQAIVPDALRGRVNASYRFVSWGVIPVGAYLSGLLAQQIGMQATLFIAALGLTTAQLWFYMPPIPTLRAMPAPLDADEPEPAPLPALAQP